MAADGQIVLGLNISETTSQISADLSTILNGLGTKQLILKAAIEKSQVEKGVASLVKEINQETAKIGIEVDPKSVSKVITQQQKMASMQKELVQQMEKYKQAASDVGLTLKGATQNSFKSAIDANDFKAAKESLRSVKKEIDEYNTAIRKMNEDTKLDFDIQNIQSKFSVLKNQTDSVKTLFKQLEQSQENFNNATSNPQKLQYYNELKRVVGQLEVEYQALKQSESALAIDSGIKKQMQDMDTYVKNLKTTYSTIGDSAGAEKLKNAIQELDTVLQNVDRNAVGGKLATEWEAVTEKVNAAKRAVSEYRAEQSVISKKVDILDSISEKAGTMKLNIDTSGIAGSGITELSKRFDELSSRAKQLKSELQDLDPSNGEDVQRLTQEVRKLQDEFNNLSKSSNVFKDTASIQKFTGDIEKARSKVSDYAATYSAIKSRPDLVRELEQLQAAAANISTPAELKKFNSEFDTFNSKVVQAGVHCKSFGDQIKQAFQNFSAFFSASRVIYQVIDSIKQMVTNVIELNTAMVELRKVTDGTENQFNTFLKNAKSNAVELGSTVTDLVNATSAFSRLGYSLDESEELGRVATIYANVGDDIDNIDQATTSLISTMKGFGLEAGDAINIVDKFNEVGNKFAISSGGIGDALQRSAASFAAANNTIDESIALVVAANNVIQDPDTVGTMWKTVTMRIRGAKTELEEAGLETEYMAESTASLRDAIKGLTNVDGLGGFDIMKDEKTFKSTYDIILGIGEVWEKMSDIDQAALLELVAGKRQGNALAATLTNLEDLKAALEASENSAGSAMKEQEVWLGSLEAKINQFKASFESLSSTIISDDLVGAIIDFGTTFVHTIDNVINSLGGMGNSLLILLDVIALFNFNKTVGLVQSIWNSLQTGFGIIPKITSMFGNLKAAWDLGKESGGGFITTLKGAASALTATGSAATVATAAIMAVVAVIAIAVVAYKNWKQAQEEARKAVIDAGNAASEKATNIAELANAYLDLCEAVDAGTASVEDASAARDALVNALGMEESKLDSLIAKYGDYKTAILEATMEALRTETNASVAGANAAKDQVVDDLKTGYFGGNSKFFSAIGEEAGKAMDYLKELGYEGIDNTGSKGGGTIFLPSVYLTGGDTAKATFDDLMADYKFIESAMNDVIEEFGADNPVAEELANLYSEYSDELSGAIEQIETANKNIASQLMLAERISNDPTTQDGFEKFRENIISNLEGDSRFDDSVGSAEEYVDAVLRENEQYAKYLEAMNEQEQIAQQVKTKRSEIKRAFAQSDTVQNVSWPLAEQRLKDFNEYIDGLSDEKIELVYDLVINANVDSLDEIKNAVDAADLEKKILGDTLKEYEDIYNQYNKIVNDSKLLGVDLSQTIFGNIDTNNRQVLEWTDENLATYKDAIESWGSTVDELRGSFSTVFGGAEEFDGVEIAFSPILQTDDGAVLLSRDTVYDYINGLIDKAGEGWTNEDLFRLDTEGLDVDGQHIKGLLADIGETAIWTSEAMHFTGDTGAISDMYAELEAAAEKYGVSVEALLTYLDTQRFTTKANEIRTALSDLFVAEDFADTRKSIIEMSKAVDGITAENVEELAQESAGLKTILDQDGMSAKFLANILQNVAEGKDGFALITDNALLLNQALEGMERSFDKVTEAKSRYDAAMSVPEKDEDFKSYAEAFKALNEQFEAGTVNSNAFWAAAEFLFGSDQLNEWGWSDGLDEIYQAMKKNVDIFEDADSAGAGFLERLNEIAENGQVLDDDGNIIAEIEKFADGSYEFNIDSTSVDILAEKLGISEDAALACLKALSMWGEVDFYNVDEVLDAIDQIGLSSDSLEGTAINISALTDQLISLGYTDKEIHDLLTTLQSVEGISFLSASADVDTLTNSLKNLGLASGDGLEVKVNTESLSVLMEQLGFTKDDAETLIGKLGEVDSITLTNAQGQAQSLDEALDFLDTLDFAPASTGLDDLKTGIEEVDGTGTDNAQASLDALGTSADTAKGKVSSLQTSINNLTGKTVTVNVDVKRKSGILSWLGFAKGTKNAPDGDALVGEEGEELVQSGDRAYLVGTNGPEITHLNEGDIVYTAEQTKKIKRGSTVVKGVIPAYAGGTINPNKGSKKGYKSVLPSSKSSRSTKKAETEFERLYKYHQHLLAMDQEQVADYLQWLDSAYKAAYEKGEIELDDYYKYEEEVFEKIKSILDDVRKEHENAIKLNQNWLNNAIDDKDFEGITKYTAEIVNHYKAMQEEVHKQAEYYRSLGYSDTSDEVSKLSDLWWEYYDAIAETSANAWQQVVDNAHDAIDEITGLYDTLKSAAEEFSEVGQISVSTFQSIAKLGIENLSYLQDENGMLVINEENIQKVIAARTQQMAIETALSYVQQLRQAQENGEISTLANLTLATQVTTQSTWDLVYAQLRLLGLQDEYFNGAIQNINNLRSLSDMVAPNFSQLQTQIKETNDVAKKVLENQEDALNDLLKYVEEMIKQEVKNQVEALEDQVDAMKEIVSLQKKSLDLEKEKDGYTKAVTDKEEAIADLRKQIAALDLDDSREAAAKKAKLQEELSEKINDLADYQSDHAYDAASDMLDDMADAYEKEKQKEIDILENSISSEEKVYRLAIDRINNHWDTLYQDLINWNYEYGSVTNDEITKAWEGASAAVNQYGSYLNAVLQTQQQLAALEASSSGGGLTGTTGTPNIIGNSGNYDTSGGQETENAHNIIKRMYANSQAWASLSPEKRTAMHEENKALAAQLSRYGINAVTDGSSWYVDRIGGALLYDKYKRYTYHNGGIVGDDPTLKQDEVFAKLKKGEAVLTEEQQEPIYEILDFADTMLGKYGTLFGAVQSTDLIGSKMQEQIKQDAQQAQSIVDQRDISIENNVTIPVQVLQKLDDKDVKKLTKDISQYTITALNDSFIKRGKTRTSNPLKP